MTMNDEELKKILIVKYSQRNSYYVNSGSKTLGEFIDFIKNPPDDTEEETKYFGKYSDREYDCSLVFSDEFIKSFIPYPGNKHGEPNEFDLRPTCNITLKRHYRKNTLYFTLDPIMDELPERFLFPTIRFINKEFELGECDVISNILYTREESK